MKPETKKAVDRAVEKYRRQMVRVMARQAVKAYIRGDVEARMLIGERVLSPKDWMVINSSAVAYSKEYSRMLEKTGSSVINGVEKPWLKTMVESDRGSITEIIRRGLEEGKATGYKESSTGTYPKNSIAAELDDFFEGKRKSYATMVARTELGRIQNQAKLSRWDERGYGWVQVLDDHVEGSCQECKDAHGQVWSVEEAQSRELEHPNCVRSFRPLRVKPPEGEEPEAPAPEEGPA